MSSQSEVIETTVGKVAAEPLRRGPRSAHLPAVLEGLAHAKRREFVTDGEVEAAFRRFDR